MLEIKGTEFCLSIDEDNVTVMKKRIAGKDSTEPGKEYFLPQAYFPTITNGGQEHGIIMALHYIADVVVFTAPDIEEMTKEQNKLHKAIKDLKNEICGFLDCNKCFANFKKDSTEEPPKKTTIKIPPPAKNPVESVKKKGKRGRPKKDPNALPKKKWTQEEGKWKRK